MQFRRVVGLITGLAFVQLSLVGASPLCRAGVADRQMTASTSAASHGDHESRHAPASHDAHSRGSLPVCNGTAMCAVVMIAAVSTEVPVATPRHSEVVRLSAAAPLSVTRRPELPPPRG